MVNQAINSTLQADFFIEAVTEMLPIAVGFTVLAIIIRLIVRIIISIRPDDDEDDDEDDNEDFEEEETESEQKFVVKETFHKKPKVNPWSAKHIDVKMVEEDFNRSEFD